MNKFFKSFGFAWKGIVTAIAEQRNLKIELACGVVVTIAGFYFKVTSAEWMMIVFAIGFVLVTEFINTAIEYLVDLVSPEKKILAGKIKDVAAAAVLVASITALIIGAIIFYKHLT